MSAGELLGTLFVAALLALLGRALLRMQPAAPYLALALVLCLADLALRVLAPWSFAEGAGALTFAVNPARAEEADAGWPNRVVIFLLTALALWLTVRPRRRSPLVGLGLALVVPGGVLNLAEPLLRGYTTDYLLLGDWIANLADLALVAGLPLLAAGVVLAETARPRRA